ncbi:hypothetical protein PULV_b0007 [Pseudoalteromonas ulvae UL12]|uniref:Uncharacterized protein n=1 Tax=Pseudoalteromonas ulvae TaxID=107327 RepID=A0A244CR26_PSEDV|nr:hypothetical protein [Pseudoalteromonas ulvae]MBE0365434.1 hypothetical protein [Pseudoalteromonas ulvae UL12]OUL58054.1 hypothetical protein B1199_06780 [Pseudoalteromonas ulvae]
MNTNINHELAQLKQAFKAADPRWVEQRKIDCLANKIAQLRALQQRQTRRNLLESLEGLTCACAILVLPWLTTFVF